MKGTEIGHIVARGVLLISAAVVLGLSINLHMYVSDAKDACEYYNRVGRGRYDCSTGRLLPSLAYGAAAGAFGLLDCLVGLVAAFASFIPIVVMAVLDGLAALLLLAHGINFAVLLGDPSQARTVAAVRAQTDTAFAFIGFIAVCVASLMVMLSRR